MSPWRSFRRGWRALTQAGSQQDLTDEVQDYVERSAAAYRAQGYSDAEARRAARAELGSVAGVREQMRGHGWEMRLQSFGADLRYAARRLRSEPGFSAVVILTLATGIGATAAIFSAVRPVLFASLPYPEPDRIAVVVEAGASGSRNPGTFNMYRGIAERTRSFERLAVLKAWRPTVIGAEEPERIEGQRVSADYFRVLGVHPALGRDFDAADDRPNGPSLVVVSDALWRRRFGADPSLVGRTVTLNESGGLGTAQFQVIGIMPRGFENVLAPSAEIWAPLQYDGASPRSWGHHLQTIGRLRAGISEAAATRETHAVAHAVLDEQKPDSYGPNVLFQVESLQGHLTASVRRALLTVLAAVFLVLVIACVNVTNLLLARGVRRRGEFALRVALGAGAGRLVRQLLTETLLLALAGAAVGLVVARFGIQALIALSPAGLPRASAISLDGPVFVFALAVSTVVALACGIAPALQAASGAPHIDLQHGGRLAGGRHHRTRAVLVVAEVALALVLLVTSGLLLRSLERLFAVNAGFEASDRLTLQVLATGAELNDPAASQRYFTAVLDAVRRVPGVSAAALTSQLPMSGDQDEYGAGFAATPDRDAATFSVYRYAVSADYLTTLGIGLRRGRGFAPADNSQAPLVALISESLARSAFGGRDPIGARMSLGPVQGYTVVGVVADVKQLSLSAEGTDAVYLPAEQWPLGESAMSLVVRGSSVTDLVPALRAAVWSVDRNQPIVRVAMLDTLLSATAAERRFALRLFEAFALAALVLAGAGIYGVLSGSVAERTREIGVRAALGASRGAIVGGVVRHGLLLTGLGTVIGVAGAVAGTRAVVAMLFGVSRLDAVTYVAVIVLLGMVSLVACAVPAWRAARVDPVLTLRQE